MLGKDSIFRTRKPKAFTYQPLYWDPEKEEKLKQERWRETGHNESAIRFTRQFQEQQTKKVNRIRVTIILLLLLILFIFFW